MQRTLAEIAKFVEGEVVGDGNLVIKGLKGIEDAQKGDLTFIANTKYIPLLKKTKASAVITDRHLDVPNKPLIRTDNPSLAFAQAATFFSDGNKIPVFKGIHPTAVIAQGVSLGKDVSVGPCVVIESKVKIGDKTIVHAGSYIGYESQIGRDCLIYPNVTIRERIVIKDRVIIHSGTVIGSDGFGYEKVKNEHKKIAQLGTVVVEDDVEIGANVAIDRARFDKTTIGKGTKIDNLVQIAHNVIIGENCLIIAQVGISGSVHIEKGAILAGQSGVVGHIHIGEGAIVTAQAGVTKDIPANTTVWGYPARPHAHMQKVNAAMQRLPLYVKTIQDLKRRIEQLENKIKKSK